MKRVGMLILAVAALAACSRPDPCPIPAGWWILERGDKPAYDEFIGYAISVDGKLTMLYRIPQSMAWQGASRLRRSSKVDVGELAVPMLGVRIEKRRMGMAYENCGNAPSGFSVLWTEWSLSADRKTMTISPDGLYWGPKKTLPTGRFRWQKEDW